MTDLLHQLLVCWTTFSQREDAERFARLAIERDLASCAQVDAPTRSFYSWQGRVESEEETRVWLKVTENRLDALEALLLAEHPYQTPQWIVMRPEKVEEKYLKWAQ